jgi:2-phospho-L-lactate guanylyltransferase
VIVAVVPLKALVDAKSRLAPHLDREARGRVMRVLLERTVGMLRHCASIEAIALATSEEQLAHELGTVVINDPGSLNGALTNGVRWARSIGAQQLLILPADLPRVEVDDVQALIDAAPRAPAIAIARTRDGGTGGLLLTPPDAIPLRFGPDSFQRHLLEASTVMIEAIVVARDGLSRDLDTIADLRDAVDNSSLAGMPPVPAIE